MNGRAVLFLTCVCAGTAFGQARPEAIVRAFFKAEDEARWVDAARLLELKAFEPYRDDAIRQARAMKGRSGPTPEQVMARDPQMPRVVAEYVASQYSAYADSDALSRDFAHTISPDSLEAMPADIAAARWLEARDPRWQWERAVAHLAAKCIKPKTSAEKWPVKEVLEPAVKTPPSGEVADSVAYVLFRDTGSRPYGRVSKSNPPGVVTLLLIDKQWKILPLADLGFSGAPPSYALPACATVSGPARN